jgi:hypothetical protein
MVYPPTQKATLARPALAEAASRRQAKGFSVPALYLIWYRAGMVFVIVDECMEGFPTKLIGTEWGMLRRVPLYEACGAVMAFGPWGLHFLSCEVRRRSSPCLLVRGFPCPSELKSGAGGTALKSSP